MSTHEKGEIRLRSNIVLADRPEGEALQSDARPRDDWWRLVPGDLVEFYKPGFLSRPGASGRQRSENGYYLECSYCQRLSHEISLNGCSNAMCVPPSESEVRRAQGRRSEALTTIEREMEMIRKEQLAAVRRHRSER